MTQDFSKQRTQTPNFHVSTMLLVACFLGLMDPKSFSLYPVSSLVLCFVHVCEYIHVLYVYTYVCIYVCGPMCCVLIHTCGGVWLHVCVVGADACVCIHVYMYAVWLHVCVVCVDVWIHVHVGYVTASVCCLCRCMCRCVDICTCMWVVCACAVYVDACVGVWTHTCICVGCVTTWMYWLCKCVCEYIHVCVWAVWLHVCIVCADRYVNTYMYVCGLCDYTCVLSLQMHV